MQNQTQHQLADAVAFITGGAQGLGEALCRSLGEAGAHIVVADLHQDRAESMAEKLRHEGIEAWAVAVDVSDPSQGEAAVRLAMERYGRIDVLINNAGTFSFGPAETLGERDLRATFETNVFGAFGMTMAVLPGMRARRSGRIVNVSSAGALAVRPFMTGYSASKHALDAITSGLDGELRGFGIRVTSVCPVSFVTDIVRATPPADTPYGNLPARFFEEFTSSMRSRPDATPVVEAIVEAATVADPPIRTLVAPQITMFDAIMAAKDGIEKTRRSPGAAR